MVTITVKSSHEEARRNLAEAMQKTLGNVCPTDIIPLLPSIMITTSDATKKTIVGELLSWVKSVYSYYYQKLEEIEQSDDPESVEIDFESIPKPNVDIKKILST